MNKVLVIAEVGINANGNLLTALQLMDEAKKAGADLVKFQKRTIEKVYSKEELDKLRDSPWGATNRQQKQGLEFSKEAFDEINLHSKEIGLPWFASAWDLESQAFLKQYDLPYNKVASAMLGHIDFLKMVASEKKHTFISTGLHNLEEIQNAYNIFFDASCPITLLHCNGQYPAPVEETNLKCIETLRDRFKCDVGFSNHYVGVVAPVIAVALGATVVEAHITLDRSMYGSDQAASLEPAEFQKVVDYIRVVEKILGDGNKIIYPDELPIRKKLARTKDY
jgi:N-acetylneuraminate synthase